MQAELFDTAREDMQLSAGARLLAGFALDRADALVAAIRTVVGAAPFRHLVTPGGRRMSVAMTNCGELGWVSDARGYRYDPVDPETGSRWPAMPTLFQKLARDAAERIGITGFAPDACLINRYVPGARLSLHQDRDERDLAAPIVSVSLGLPATFLWGGARRGDPTRRVRVEHGDVVAWGPPSRLNFHGVSPLEAGVHPSTGAVRLNLTFRQTR
jgi:alkylated DNA repair protein (DNA oxidative demethylase)